MFFGLRVGQENKTFGVVVSVTVIFNISLHCSDFKPADNSIFGRQERHADGRRLARAKHGKMLLRAVIYPEDTP